MAELLDRSLRSNQNDEFDASRYSVFGEYLVEQGLLDRFQLFCALQLQDRLQGARIGECVAALGYAPIACVEKIFLRFMLGAPQR